MEGGHHSDAELPGGLSGPGLQPHLIALLRISGKRTLAKLNAFDFVITVALASTLATVLLSPDVALIEGVPGLAMLIGLQFAIACPRCGGRALPAWSKPSLS